MSVRDLIGEVLGLQPNLLLGFFGAQSHLVQSSCDLYVGEGDPEALIRILRDVEVGFQRMVSAPTVMKHQSVKGAQ